ncbi:MAG: PQQ-dependent sugar dehydrogenase [Rhodothermales bacterium]
MSIRRSIVFVAALLAFVMGCSGPSTDTTMQVKPDETRFTPVVLAEGDELNEPMAFDVLGDGRVLIVERKGGFKMYVPETDSVHLIDDIPVNIFYTNLEGETRNAEEGLVGVSADPDFDENGWVYLLYAHPDEAKHELTRFTLDGPNIVPGSRQVLLDFPVQRRQCCHTGGGMTWDADGNLYVTIGNNTSNDRGSQTDERPGREPWDDQRGAANTNDLRGKIIRIHPENDGTYSIPEGNLFPEGTPSTRPEIYTMGHRNAWRVSIDSETGYMYWGEVGPDAREDTELGPQGYDELNQARGPGNFGWPYFVGENHAFAFQDFVRDTLLPPKDPNHPINTSVNNTGLTELPPAQPAFISYPYGYSEKFPEVGTGGRSANGGPIYHRADFDDPERPFPAYYEGMWLVSDFSRGWLMAITLDENGDYVSMERFLPEYRPVEPIDMKFGPEGDLYVLEYGETWFSDGQEDKLVRIEYNAGNRAPIARVSTSARGGSVPFEVALSGEGSHDYDGDELSYTWDVAPARGGEVRTLEGANPSITFDAEGVYIATLEATDPSGASSTSAVRIVAGNTEPSVALQFDGNQTFFFPGEPIAYDVHVRDAEDGSLSDGGVSPDRVAVTIDYVSQGLDADALADSEGGEVGAGRFAVAQLLMSGSDCAVCHQPEAASNGPSYLAIAERYAGDDGAAERLAQKVVEGGTGNWEAETVMPAHPALSINDARTMVDYILSVGNESAGSLPVFGTYVPSVPENDYGRGSVIMRAAYTDRGAGTLPSQRSEHTVVLRSPILDLGSDDEVEGARMEAGGRGSGPMTIIPQHGGHAAFRNIDLTGVGRIDVTASASSRTGDAGGTVEVRLGGPTGMLLGEVVVDAPDPEAGFRRGPDPVQSVQVSGAEGHQDLYLVFRNDAVNPDQPLMSLSRVELVHASNTADGMAVR